MFGGGAQLWSSQHDLLGSFDHLCRDRSFVCGDSGMDRASLDPNRYRDKSPSDLHYIAVGIVLVVSAGLGVLVASQIVVVLGYTG